MSDSKIQGQLELSSLNGSYHLTPDSSEDLVVLVHGKAGNRQVMSIFEKSFPSQANFIYPEANLPDPIGGFSWWLEANTESYQSAALRLQQFIQDSVTKFNLKPKRVIACGFSQGGACLSWLSQLEEGSFSHLIMICSFYLEQEKSLNTYPSTFIYHGLEDQVIKMDQAQRALSFLTDRKASVTLTCDIQGHKISSKGMKSLRDWLIREL